MVLYDLYEMACIDTKLNFNISEGIPTCGLQCSSSQLMTQAESSAKLATEMLLNVRNN